MPNDNRAKEIQAEQDQIIELGSNLAKSEASNIYTLTIIGQIEGHQVLPDTLAQWISVRRPCTEPASCSGIRSHPCRIQSFSSNNGNS